MLFRFRNFRLLALVVATLIILLMLFARRWGDWVTGWTLIEEWHRGTVSHEAFLSYLVKTKLHEPIVPLDSTIHKFVKPEMDEAGFIQWMKEVAPQQPLVGAGFVWHRDSTNLTIYPNTTGIDTTSQRLLLLYINTDNDLKLNSAPQRPTSTFGYFDSLKSVIHEHVGYSLFSYDYYYGRKEGKGYKTHLERAAATKVIFGLVWNEKFYADSLLPGLTKQINDDAYSYGMLPHYFMDSNYWNNGILITKPDGDTLYQLGKVNLTPDSVVSEWFPGPTPAGYYWKSFSDQLGWMPGWKLYVQDRWDIPMMKELWKARGDDIYNESSEYIPFAIRGIVRYPQQRFAHMALKTLSWVSLAIALFFIVIIGEIRARNRQREFIAHISHELRTPVAKVKLFAETLRNDRAVSAEKEDEYLDTILSESGRLSVLIDNTLNWARLEEGRLKVTPQPLDLSQWLTQYHQSQASFLTEAGFVVKLEVAPNLPKVSADPEALTLVMNNLLDNAVKYSPEKKEIEITAQITGKGKVQLAVADRGLAIPANKRKAVFRRFYRIKQTDREPVGGAGIGLSLVKEIVSRLKGKVWCEGREGGGNRFVVELGVATLN